MALPAEEHTEFETSGTRLELPPPPRPSQMPINPVERKKRMRRDLSTRASELLDSTKREAERLYDEARDRASDLVDTTRREAERLYEEARIRATEGYERASETAQDATEQTRHVARYLRNEYPLELIGVLAGAAFLAGMALRIWRSRA